MKRNPQIKQRGMFCPCGRLKIIALGLCSSCYSMKRQDEENYGGLREAVLDRDRRRCPVCPNTERRKLYVHHCSLEHIPAISSPLLGVMKGDRDDGEHGAFSEQYRVAREAPGHLF